MTASLNVTGLTRHYGSVAAVDGLDLELYPGQIFGLLGPNAAGKTTTIRMLAGILRPTGGTATVLGMDLVRNIAEIRPRIGYVAQHFALYPELTVAENLDFYSSLYGKLPQQRQRALLESHHLSRFANRHAGRLSGGYKRRLSIVCALSHDPDVIFLDEPTAGIDPVTRKQLWDLFYDLAADGKTLFVTTHYMEEAERCHRLSFLSRGRRVASGTPDEIRALLGDMQVFTFTGSHDRRMAGELARLPGVRVINRFGHTTRLVADARLSPGQLARFLAGWPGISGTPATAAPSLEDVFITLTEDPQA